MKRAIMRGSVLVLAVALLLCGVLCGIVFDLELTRNMRRDMSVLAELTADSFDPDSGHDEQARRFSASMGGLRVTVIDPDGTVTGDSAADYRAMENHLNRAEILEARGTRTAVSVRSSETLGTRLIYAVSRTGDGHYIRLAREYSGLLRDLWSFAPAIALAAAVSLLLALLLTGRISASVTRPLTALNDALTGVKDGSTRLDPESYRHLELRDMAVKINGLSDEISRHLRTLEEEREKIDYMLDNMAEGFLLLDEKQTVLIINESACALLGCDKSVTGKHILYATRQLYFVEAVERASRGDAPLQCDLEVAGRTIEIRIGLVHASPSMDRGLIVTLSDVTENRQAVRARRDFFQNASHELNTPITSIKGFAELLQAGVSLDDGQYREIVERIGKESERISRLIADIIRISRLESGDISGEAAPADFSALVAECCGEAHPLCEQYGVTLRPDLTPGLILQASQVDLHSLASNLIVNAIKYNRPGGAVDISLTRTENQLRFTVRNDGDPIPPEDQGRVFERFYRVSKGRSQAVGGTGLGLSIVKHVVEKLGGGLHLQSDRETGTTFTVTIPIRP